MNIVTTMFGGEERSFGFNLNEIEELQRLCGNVSTGARIGLGTIVNRVMENDFFFEDIYHTIRLGLIGSGECAPTRAKELVDTYTIGKPLAVPTDPSAPLTVAKVILGSIMFGVAEMEEEGPKKEQGDAMTDTSMSPPSEPPLSEPE